MFNWQEWQYRASLPDSMRGQMAGVVKRVHNWKYHRPERIKRAKLTLRKGHKRPRR